ARAAAGGLRRGLLIGARAEAEAQKRDVRQRFHPVIPHASPSRGNSLIFSPREGGAVESAGKFPCAVRTGGRSGSARCPNRIRGKARSFVSSVAARTSARRG